MINFIATRPVTPIPMCCLRVFVVKKINHPNSDSKYVLGKVHLYFFWRGGGGGEGRGEGRDENIRALLAAFFFFTDFRAPSTVFLYSLHIKLSAYVFATNMREHREE